MRFVTITLGLLLTTSCEILGKQSGKQFEIKFLPGFLEPSDFYSNYVIPGIPVLFKDASKSFPAYQLWSDEYLSSFKESENYKVDIEEGKKENRGLGSLEPSFKEFLEMYQTEDIYFVSEVPTFLRKDIPIYKSINCPYILENLLIDLVMWFSSGGTTSVWHNDAYENINCLIKGDKTLILANKSDLQYVYLDIPEGAYSSIDVDNVDNEKYPLLKHVKFYNVTMEAGDCLYIPSRWFHYVRSYNRNIAVNKWWHAHKSQITCNEKSLHSSMESLEFSGASGEENYPLYRSLITDLYMSHHLYVHDTMPRDLFVDIVTDFLVDKGYHESAHDSYLVKLTNFVIHHISPLLGLKVTRNEMFEGAVENLFSDLDQDNSGELNYLEINSITDMVLAKVLQLSKIGKTEL